VLLSKNNHYAGPISSTASHEVIPPPRLALPVEIAAAPTITVLPAASVVIMLVKQEVLLPPPALGKLPYPY
jgi:hypothetical protein